MHSPTLRNPLPVSGASADLKVIQGSIAFYWPLNYVILGGTQWTDENLTPVEQPLEHRFAVIYNHAFRNDWVETLERVRDMGGLSSVTLVDVSEESCYVILDAQTSSSTVATIEAIWSAALNSGDGQRRTVCFASESEIWTDRCDYAHSQAAKVIFDSNLLGIVPAPPSKSEGQDYDHRADHSEVFEGMIKNFFGHSSQMMTEYYVKQGRELKHRH